MLFEETRRIGVAAWREGAAFLVLMTALATASDLHGSKGQAGVNLAGLVAGYYLARSMTVKAGLVSKDVKRSIWPYIGLGIISELAILLGLVLLFVPGVILGVRWMAAYGYLLAEGQGVTQSLKSSWEATRPHFLPLLVTAAVPFALLVGGTLAFVFLAGDADPSLPVSLAGNVVIYGSTVAWTALGLATYSLLAHLPREAGLAEVFS